MSVACFLPVYCTQDTKPHREIPLAQILDALDYDLPSHRHVPSVSGPTSVSPPQASSSAGDEGDGTHGRYTFKVVTTKRTLLLCAPSEEEEIKWLSAVRALIARRSGAGVVPGDAPSKAGASAGVVPSSEVHGSHGERGSGERTHCECERGSEHGEAAGFVRTKTEPEWGDDVVDHGPPGAGAGSGI